MTFLVFVGVLILNLVALSIATQLPFMGLAYLVFSSICFTHLIRKECE